MATELLLMQLSTGAKAPRRTLKAKQRDSKIRELKDRFLSNSISLSEYIIWHGCMHTQTFEFFVKKFFLSFLCFFLVISSLSYLSLTTAGKTSENATYNKKAQH